MSEAAPVCAFCDRVLDEHNRNLRFGLPDPVLAVPETEREGRTWGDDVMMSLEDVGAFVRVLLPVRLTGGYSIRYGLWLGVSGDALREAHRVWWEDSYGELVLTGIVANSIPPWGKEVFGAWATATVRDRDQVPYITETPDPVLSRLLADEWDHNFVLAPWE